MNEIIKIGAKLMEPKKKKNFF